MLMIEAMFISLQDVSQIKHSALSTDLTKTPVHIVYNIYKKIKTIKAIMTIL